MVPVSPADRIFRIIGIPAAKSVIVVAVARICTTTTRSDDIVAPNFASWLKFPSDHTVDYKNV
jgi:hypothetical protein